MKRWMLATLMGALVVVGCGGSGESQPETAPAAQPGEAAGAGGSTLTPAPQGEVAPQAAAPGGAAAKSEPAAAPEPEYREVTIPASTPLALDLKSSVASDSSRVEDTVTATLREAVIVDGREVLPAGTELVGAVIAAESSGRVKGRASVAFRFTSLRHAGERYDIETASISRVAEATKGEDAKKIGIGAGAGAALGALIGGGGGAAKGAAIGGAAGTGVVLATKGKEVRLGPGANVATKLTAPVTVRIRNRA